MDTLSKHGLKPIKGFKCIFVNLVIGFALGTIYTIIAIGDGHKNSAKIESTKRVDLWKDAVTRGYAEAIENEKGEITYRWK